MRAGRSEQAHGGLRLRAGPEGIQPPVLRGDGGPGNQSINKLINKPIEPFMNMNYE